MNQNELRVFYSWQSDLDPERHANLIRHALRDAASELERQGLVARALIDEATRERPGTPDIPASILEKVAEADVFVADLTTVDRNESKAFPNPNVAIELGFAAARLGWDRIIIVVNRDGTSVPSDLPFDVRTRRVTPYMAAGSAELAAIKGSVANARGQLKVDLAAALRLILSSDPARPVVSRVEPEWVRRQRDLRQIRDLLAYVNPEALGELIEKAPAKVPRHADYFQEGFAKRWNSPATNLHDSALRAHFESLHEPWERLVSNSMQQAREVGEGDFEWRYPDCEHQHHYEEARRHYDAAWEARAPLDRAIRALWTYLLEHYLELDVSDLVRQSWNGWRSNEGVLESSASAVEAPPPESVPIETRTYPVELKISYALESIHKDVGGYAHRHDYVLAVELANRSTRTLREWHVDLELPAPLRRANTSYSALVSARSTADISFFRISSDERGALRPDDSAKLTIPYMVDARTYENHRAVVTDSVIRARAYVDGALVAADEVGADRFQNF